MRRPAPKLNGALVGRGSKALAVPKSFERQVWQTRLTCDPSACNHSTQPVLLKYRSDLSLDKVLADAILSTPLISICLVDVLISRSSSSLHSDKLYEEAGLRCDLHWILCHQMTMHDHNLALASPCCC